MLNLDFGSDGVSVSVGSSMVRDTPAALARFTFISVSVVVFVVDLTNAYQYEYTLMLQF